MKLLEIHIYGYGKFEDKKFSCSNDFQVLFGENEAGKSTIMSFIHSILFGFPAKQQPELRYEPKLHAKYGGRLTVQFPEHGVTIIERVRGKAAGDVTVMLENGSSGGEALLKELLLNIDKSLFQAIYSFNLGGLQNVHQLKSQEMGKFLFSAGTLGTDRLLTVENKLQKEMDGMFKPNGKKPLLNEKLTDLRQLHRELKTAEQQNNEYWSLIKERESLSAQLHALLNRTENIRKEIDRLQVLDRHLPLIKEEKIFQETLLETEEASFPIDGLARFEQLEKMIQPIEAQIEGIKDRLDTLKGQLENITPNQFLLTKEAEINTALGKLPLYEQLSLEEQQLQGKLEELTEEISILKEKLHLPVDEAVLTAINTSVFTKERAAKLQEKQLRLLEKKQDLDERFSEEKTALEKIEESMGQVKQQQLPEEERTKLKDQLDRTQNPEELERELRNVREKISDVKTKQQKEQTAGKKQKQQEAFQLLLFGVIFLGLILWGLTSKQWFLAAAGGGGVLILLIFKRKHRYAASDEERDKELQILTGLEQELLNGLKTASIQNGPHLQARITKDNQLREKYAVLAVRAEQQNEQYEKVIQAFEAWEHESLVHDKKLLELGNELGLPAKISRKHIFDAFQLIEKLKLLSREKHRVQERLNMIRTNCERMSIDISLLSAAFVKENLPIQQVAFLLRKKLKEELEKQILFREKQMKLSELEDDMQRLIREQQHFALQKTKLMQLANAKTEEHYRELGREAEKRSKLLERLDQLERQLQLSSITLEEKAKVLASKSLEEHILNLDGKLNSDQQQLSKTQEQLAAVKYKIGVLEAGGLYRELLHRFKQKKHEFAEEAKIWAKYAVAKDILSKTIERYKNERLPKILVKAEAYLRHLTDGNYERIHPHTMGSGFLIERKDRIMFEAGELSQATAEQVYVSLRLALAVSLYERFRFPIIIDDSFVNFDHFRTKKVIEILKKSAGHQVLFFTCHQHMLPHFGGDSVLNLTGKDIQAPGKEKLQTL